MNKIKKDILDLLSMTIWMTGREIGKKYEKVHNKSLSVGVLYAHLDALVREGYVQNRLKQHSELHEFKLTQSGLRARSTVPETTASDDLQFA